MKIKRWKMIGHIVIVPVAIFISFAAILFLFQARLIYYPSRRIRTTPEDIGLSYEKVSFAAQDGIKLSGWFIPAEKSRGTLLFCHGNAGNISNRLESIDIFNQLGLSVFIFDYRGYGESEGKPTEKGTYQDGEAAWFYLTKQRQLSPDEIIIFGRSLGGGIASWLAQKHPPRMLILESTFTSLVAIGSEIYPFLPVKWLSRFRYDTLSHLKDINCSLLVVHSRNDELIPFHHGQRLFEAATPPKEFLEISGDHNNGFQLSRKGYVEGLDIFISEQL